MTGSSEGGRRIRASVPGKLILMGEHAAVYGFPAVVAALDRRLRVQLVEARDENVVVELPQLGGFTGRSTWSEILELNAEARRAWERWHAAPSAGALASLHTDRPDRLILLALGEAASRAPAGPRTGLRIQVRSELPPRSGFGSSAAVAVATIAAFFAHLESPLSSEELFEMTLAVERRQHGSPSGIDNATVAGGGVLWAENRGAGLSWRTLAASPDLLGQLSVFHTGAPTQTTGEMVSLVRRRREAAPAELDAAFETIGAATHQLAETLIGRGSATKLGDLLSTCEAELERIGVVPESVQREIRRIEASGGAAKISGAGALSAAAGAVLAWHPEPEALAGLSLPWQSLDVQLGAPGLEIHSSSSTSRPLFSTRGSA